MVRYDEASIFTKVPVEESFKLHSQNINKKTLSMYKHLPTCTYFCVDGQLYKQTDGGAMGSPHSPDNANYYMEDLETKTIEKVTQKPACLYRYLDDTFVTPPHKEEKPMDFLHNLNGIHNKIHLTMEIEEVGHLPFLYIDIYRNIDCSLRHKVYRKPTHPKLYLQQKSHQHPANKKSVLSSLVHRAKILCDQESLAPELTFLTFVIKQIH